MRKTNITINESVLLLVEYQGQRVITFEMIDHVHRRKKGTAKRAWSYHRERFVQGEDYFQLTRYEIRTKFPKGVFDARAPEGIVLTESGYLILTKSLNDDLAWWIQRQLVGGYFRPLPEFPELNHVAIPAVAVLAEMPLQEAQHTIAQLEHESFHGHGQRGSQSMALRRREKKKITPLLVLVQGWSQPQLTGFDAACGQEERLSDMPPDEPVSH